MPSAFPTRARDTRHTHRQAQLVQRGGRVAGFTALRLMLDMAERPTVYRVVLREMRTKRGTAPPTAHAGPAIDGAWTMRQHSGAQGQHREAKGRPSARGRRAPVRAIAEGLYRRVYRLPAYKAVARRIQ